MTAEERAESRRKELLRESRYEAFVKRTQDAQRRAELEGQRVCDAQRRKQLDFAI
jgi:hypothetical protein